MKIGLSRLHWTNWSLGVKLTLAMTIMIMIVVMTITLISIRREQESFRTELQQQAHLLINTLEAAILDALYNLDTNALNDIMQALGGNRSIFVSGRFYDAEGMIVADAYDSDVTYALEADPFGQQLVASDSMIFDWQSERFSN